MDANEILLKIEKRAGNLRQVADFYEELFSMAKKSNTDFPTFVAIAGDIISQKLKEASYLIAAQAPSLFDNSH
jgi:hypothetical protein